MNVQLPISEYQKRFFLEWALEPQNSTYNVSLAYKISGILDEVALKKACEIFIQQHELCYANYNEDGTVCNSNNFSIDDFYNRLILNKNKSSDVQITELLNIPFDLNKGPLLKLYLLADSRDTKLNYFTVVAHHIIADAIAAEIIVSGISSNYNSIVDGIEPCVDTHKTFTQAILAEQILLNPDKQHEAKLFWESYLADFPLNIDLPIKSNANRDDKTGESVRFELNESESTKLKQLAKQCESTLFIVISAVYSILIAKYSNQDNILISYPVNMRPTGFARVTGCFVNNVPSRIEISKSETLVDLIKNATTQRKIVKEHQRYSLTNIINDQRIIRREYENQYFNVGLVEANLNIAPIQLNNLATEVFNTNGSIESIYDICLNFDPRDKYTLKFVLEYRKANFDAQLIDNFIHAFKQLINVSLDSINLKNYSVLHAADYEKIIYTWNQTERTFATNRTIHELFEEQAAHTPKQIALICENIKLTYKELNQKINQLAHYLETNYAIEKEDLIGLCLNRSHDTIIAILAVLKLGAAYVPIDSNYPNGRIAYILADTQMKIVITHEMFLDNLNGIGTTAETSSESRLSSIPQIIAIDSQNIQFKLAVQPVHNPTHKITLDSLAYVIYTSGTTGAPKGVMVEHGNVLNLILSLSHKYNFQTASERILLFSNYVFDASVAHIFLALTNGCQLIIPTMDEINNPIKLVNLIKLYKITHMESTPQYWEILDHKKLHGLRHLVSGGDYLSPDLYKKLKSHVTHIINEYGPSETTITALLSQDADNIGKPLDNYTAYILDNHLQPLPIGTIGELYIGGKGVTRGYLNRPELTAERFIPNHFQTHLEKVSAQNSRLYKTGDLARYLPDGNVEYICRDDTQVKIAGIRIELREIETILSRYMGVKQAVVLAKSVATQNIPGNHKPSLNKYLLAYYVADNILNENDVRRYLSSKLSDNMVPSILVHLHNLPLNANGKLDVNALPIPELTDHNTYISPRNKWEQQVTDIFAEILGLNPLYIGINDDFFKLGGSSILVIRLVNLLNKNCNANLNLAEIFSTRTVKNIAPLIKRAKSKYQTIVKLSKSDDKPLIFMVHPSGAGCEVYMRLANTLADIFSCYGIDNYNQYHTQKHLTIDDLVMHYLTCIQEEFKIKSTDHIQLLGWSYGGTLSLKIAHLLEKLGYKNITVYLLDTVIMDKRLTKMFNRTHVDEFKQRLNNYLINQYGNIQYVQQVMDNIMLELDLSNHIQTDILVHTKAVLFKAMQKDTRFGNDNAIDESFTYFKKLKFNNVDKIFHKKSQLKVVNIPNAHHGNILQSTEAILQGILSIC